MIALVSDLTSLEKYHQYLYFWICALREKIDGGSTIVYPTARQVLGRLQRQVLDRLQRSACYLFSHVCQNSYMFGKAWAI